MNLGKKIAVLRKTRDWTQDELGQKVNVHKTVVSRWELGHMVPRFDTLKKLAEAFGVDINELAQERPAVTNLKSEVADLYTDFEALSPDDRDTVKKVVDAMLTRQRMRQAMGA